MSPPNQPRTPTQGSSSNEPTEREARAIARTERAKSSSKAVKPAKPSTKAKARIPKALDINTGSTSRNVTEKEADEYMSYLDTQS